ncbi:hypothetical protein [Streptomyces sp. LN785]|uniref:hypothetical protein n=1 Tax=Streptomyces sp. LN785 TaxID=3112983 RepID=UPI00370FE104
MPPTPPPTPPSASPGASPRTPPAAPPHTRPRHGIALGLAAASVVLGGASTAAAVPVSVTADQPPTCGAPAAGDFPIATRIHGGPRTYASGGGYGIWLLDLTNTTSEPCRAIHPVLVLVDEDRKLVSAQIQMEFSESAHPDVEHRVTWETTDRDEHIGVFGGDGADNFGGFAVPAGSTVTVRVRLAFTSDTLPGAITAKAAIVQRKQGTTVEGGKKKTTDDGEWVGESDDYVFNVVEDEDEGGGETGDVTGSGDTGDTGDTGSGETGDVSGGTGEVGSTGDTEDAGGTGGTRDTGGEVGGTGDTGGTGGTGRADGTGPVTGIGRDGMPEGVPDRSPDGAATAESGGIDGGGGTGDAAGPRSPEEPVDPDRAPQSLPELARTGVAAVAWTVGLAAGICLVGGAAVVRGARRLRLIRR